MEKPEPKPIFYIDTAEDGRLELYHVEKPGVPLLDYKIEGFKSWKYIEPGSSKLDRVKEWAKELWQTLKE